MNMQPAILPTSQQPQPKANKRKRLGVGEWIAEIVKYAVLILLAITFVMPFYWMFSSALKNDAQVYVAPPIWFPSPAFWNNFPDAWNSQPFTQYMMNTLFLYAVPYTIGVVLSSAIVAYGFSRIQWKWRDTLFYLCLATMMVLF